jgi:ppGpp synthetase/RelA/SpoT-type nucleotidyltranferase
MEYPSCIGKNVTCLSDVKAQFVTDQRYEIKKIRQKINEMPPWTPNLSAKKQALLKKIDDIQKLIDKTFAEHAQSMIAEVDDRLDEITSLAEKIVQKSSSARNVTEEAMKT